MGGLSLHSTGRYRGSLPVLHRLDGARFRRLSFSNDPGLTDCARSMCLSIRYNRRCYTLPTFPTCWPETGSFGDRTGAQVLGIWRSRLL